MTKPAWLVRAQWGWPGRYPLVQFPNAPLAVALGASLAGRLAHGRADDYATAVFHVALGIWAWEEASRGVNGFRRALGVAGLAYVVARLAAALG
ncbi:MAG TPA: hypothetical protein VF712_05930 [Thermoleophilaceae bacterium]